MNLLNIYRANRIGRLPQSKEIAPEGPRCTLMTQLVDTNGLLRHIAKALDDSWKIVRLDTRAVNKQLVRELKITQDNLVLDRQHFNSLQSLIANQSVSRILNIDGIFGCLFICLGFFKLLLLLFSVDFRLQIWKLSRLFPSSSGGLNVNQCSELNLQPGFTLVEVWGHLLLRPTSQVTTL